MNAPAALSWSGGKDSALALHVAALQGNVTVRSLLTTVSQPQDRISMHGVHSDLLRAQARTLGLQLTEVHIDSPSTNEAYEQAFLTGIERLEQAGIKNLIFGDIFLRDVRAYRERLVARSGMTCSFPLWGQEPAALAQQVLRSGFRAIVCTIDPAQIDPKFCGREYDERFLADLPGSADPCGENGEFHTFVYDGPNFETPVAVTRNGVVERGGFWFCDLQLSGAR
ncbi:MAG: ATP-binding protein [Longimicrobiales bacterium]